MLPDHKMEKLLHPIAIVELTATPKGRSNILDSVIAHKLKDKLMLKMSVVLNNQQSIMRG